jgi:hypothetical protein
MKITNAKEARERIGKRVEWDDGGSVYTFFRSGILQDVSGRNLLIDGDWKWRSDLKCLRDCESEDRNF